MLPIWSSGAFTAFNICMWLNATSLSFARRWHPVGSIGSCYIWCFWTGWSGWQFQLMMQDPSLLGCTAHPTSKTLRWVGITNTDRNGPKRQSGKEKMCSRPSTFFQQAIGVAFAPPSHALLMRQVAVYKLFRKCLQLYTLIYKPASNRWLVGIPWLTDCPRFSIPWHLTMLVLPQLHSLPWPQQLCLHKPCIAMPCLPLLALGNPWMPLVLL